MAKLYFRYGTVCSSKSMNLLAKATLYQMQKKRIKLLKPRDRHATEVIASRFGVQMDADVVKEDTDLRNVDFSGINCILVDEAQFLCPRQIDQLRRISIEQDIPVYCYGLRTDFQTQMFPGAKRLMELADSIKEIDASCHYCDRASAANLLIVDGQPYAGNGPAVQVDGTFVPTCFGCYYQQLGGQVGFILTDLTP